MKTILIFALLQAVIVVACEFGPIGRAAPQHSDIAVPEGIAAQMLAGQRPYRDFEVEYPPLALPFFWLAGWLGGPGAGFARIFAIENLLFQTGTLLLVAAQIGRDQASPGLRARLTWFLVYDLTLWPVILTRYDPIPTFFAFAAVATWQAGRSRCAGVWAGLGCLIKLFPALVLLPQVTRDWRWTGSDAARARLGLGLTMGLGLIAWLLIGGTGVWTSIRYHSDRRVEIESVFASLIFLVDAFLGQSPIILYNFGAFHLVGDLPDLFSAISLPTLALSLLFVCSQTRADATIDPVRLACGCLLAFLVTNKVLSPQYLIWLIPFIVTLRGGRAGGVRALFAACCFLTTVEYPYFFLDLAAARPLAILIVGARNLILLLISLTVWLPETHLQKNI